MPRQSALRLSMSIVVMFARCLPLATSVTSHLHWRSPKPSFAEVFLGATLVVTHR